MSRDGSRDSMPRRAAGCTKQSSSALPTQRSEPAARAAWRNHPNTFSAFQPSTRPLARKMSLCFAVSLCTLASKSSESASRRRRRGSWGGPRVPSTKRVHSLLRRGGRRSSLRAPIVNLMPSRRTRPVLLQLLMKASARWQPDRSSAANISPVASQAQPSALQIGAAAARRSRQVII